ncbi:hypothetical protein, partial [Burkholderia oklahomensis]|uniref:hypothetical protein n=1 Tax=Burkholderia oklahomensis TaxID=342113 RepID=UPI00016A4131
MKLLAAQRATLALVDAITPPPCPVIEPVIRGVPPERGETPTPAEARERYGRISAADLPKSNVGKILRRELRDAVPCRAVPCRHAAMPPCRRAA